MAIKQLTRPRPLRFAERLEPRWMMAAAPLHFGAVYIEEDLGSDIHGDTFEIAFHGGAPGTQLTRLVIDTDQGVPGLDRGDRLFDTTRGGLGGDEAFDFAVVTSRGVEHIAPTVLDGGLQMVIDFNGFQAGDKLVITVDVDEAQDMRGLNEGTAGINAGLDPITSGVEFQGSILTATFAAPNYYTASGSAEFRNAYDPLLLGTQLDLPLDDAQFKRDRTAGAVGMIQQAPLPASLRGHVYVDLNNNGQRDPNELGIGQVPVTIAPIATIEPQPSITVLTGTDGSYAFDQLMPGQYQVIESAQPPGYVDGLDRAGSVNGVTVGTAVNPGDLIHGIQLSGGQHGVDYDFGELLLSSLRGRVHTDQNDNCWFDPGDEPLEGVQVDLLNESGIVVSTTWTDPGGFFAFDNLVPGTYTLREETLVDFFHVGQRAPGDNGRTDEDYFIRDIVIPPGVDLVDYVFCEQRPVEISGYVFQDGGSIELAWDEQLPPDLRGYRDGLRTTDDTPLAGVVVELREGTEGVPILGAAALPGRYAVDQPILAVTDQTGFYRFTGLRRGSYALLERHPKGYIDGIDTATDRRGRAVNRGDEAVSELEFVASSTAGSESISDIPAALAGLHGFDMIHSLRLEPGESSHENNFSEVVTLTSPPPKPPEPPEQPPDRPTLFDSPPPSPIPPPISVPPASIAPVPFQRPQPIFAPWRHLPDLAAGRNGTTWHLSVINAGLPRGRGDDVRLADLPWGKSFTMRVAQQVPAGETDRWFQLISQQDGESAQPGTDEAGPVPLAGDFDGDGKDELAVFDRGLWYVDLNGNGRWDDEDLWLRLGREVDQPVVGDWDGDGKDDVGIFGPAWHGDPRAIAAEPGLPDFENPPRGAAKNVPPTPDEATDGGRVMQRSSEGRIRADLIDHVFQFGQRGDRAVVGDWNGDGIATIGLFRRGQWRLDLDGDGRWTTRDAQADFGSSDDKPIVGDFDGNGIDDIAFIRDGKLTIDSNRNGRLDAEDRVIELPRGPGRPVAGDFDGDGADEIALFEGGPDAHAVIARGNTAAPQTTN